MNCKELERIEKRLLDAVEQTKALYEGAKQEFHQSWERQHDDKGRLTRARNVLHQTERNFTQALWEFNRFVLERKLPGQPST